MTEQEIELVATLAGLAVAITVADLAVSLLWRRRRAVAARRMQSQLSDENAAGEELFARLLAIESPAKEGPQEGGRVRAPYSHGAVEGRSLDVEGSGP